MNISTKKIKAFRIGQIEIELLETHAKKHDITTSHYLRRIVKNHFFNLQQMNDTPALLESNRKQ